MSVTHPRTDIFASNVFASQWLRIVSRQETSRTAGGVTLAKDLGPALWFGDWTTMSLENDDALSFEAKLNSLDGAINTFEAGDLRRSYPKAYANGAFNDTGLLKSVNTNNKALSFNNLPAGFVLTAGDYLAFTYGTSRAFHQIVESATADGSGVTPEIEVRPYIRPGFTLNAAITLKEPKAVFRMLPGSISTQTDGALFTTISFKAVQAL